MVRRKKKKTFIIFILIMAVITVAIMIPLYKFNVLPHKAYSGKDFNIVTYKSQVDMDEDGIDDQTDILAGVRKYIKTRPKYKSKYYENGYPDDEYGVCTDVVAQGLLIAGYDLREMVDEDIRNNREKYNVEAIDKNIDFRRVRNLNVYFKNNAINLTTDLKDINEWQGGDIVVFKEHIAVVSDKRNSKGIPFIIHHSGPRQLRYEEDTLEHWDIIGHYRIS